MRYYVLAVPLAALLLVPPPSPAQSSTAALTGRITDPTGAAIPSVAVSVTNMDTGIRRATASDGQGNYHVPLLDPGRYSVSLRKEGFRAVTRTAIPLQVDQVARIDFAMELGALTESIEVTGTAPLLDQETSSLGQVIENRRIVELPLNGRNVLSLVQLSPGVQPLSGINSGFVESGNFYVSNMAIGGGRGGMNAILLDGTANTSNEREEIAVSPSVDAVQEFKVNTNGATAEFGRTSGGVVSIVTKSGTNQLHGTAYEFLRNESFDARNAFAATRAPFRYNQFGGTAGGPVFLPKLYDGRNRTFFFFSYEAFRYVDYTNNLLTVPTPLQRGGDFSQTFDAGGRLIRLYDPASTSQNPAGAGYVRDPFAANLVPASRFDRISGELLPYIPGPNRTPASALTNARNYEAQTRNRNSNDQWLGRFDHQLTSKDSLTYRLAYNRNQLSPDRLFNNFLAPGGNFTDTFARNYQQTTVGWTRIFGPRTIGELRAGYVLTVLTRRPPSSPADLDRLKYPAIIPRVNFPTHGIQDFMTLGGGQIVDGSAATISVSQTITRAAGNHSLKFGGEARTLRRNRFQFGNLSGAFNFNRDLTQNPQAPAGTGYGVATFLMGAVSGGSINIGNKRHERAAYFGAFVQDDWRVRRNLTLNIGLRYDLETNPIDVFNQRSNFNLTRVNPVTGLPGVLEYAGVDYGRSPAPTDANNLGPRVGFAWTLDRAAKTVLRGTYGIYYLPGFETFESNIGWSASTVFSNPSLGPRPVFYLSEGPSRLVQPPGNSLGPAGFLGSNVSFRQSTDRVSYIQQWNFALQRALPADWVIEAAYVGSKGTRLGVGRDSGGEFNQLHPDYLRLGFDLQTQVANPLYSKGVFGATVARSQLLRPFPAYLNVGAATPRWGSSSYHSLEAAARKRLTHGYSLLLSYTNGKLIDDLPGSIMIAGYGFNNEIGGFQNAYNRRAERSVSPTDVSQRLVASPIVELPFGRGRRWVQAGPLAWIVGGWQLTGVLTLSRGQPLAIRGAQNFAADRPNSLGRSAGLPAERRARERWFDTSAFAVPALFTYGNAGRVLPDVRAAGIVNLDAGLHKVFPLREGLKLQLRGEAFNLANRVNLGGPDTNFLSNTFGQINNTSTPARILQIGAKLVF